MIKRAYIEISNICNLHCAFCKVSARPKRMLNVEEFEAIVQQVKPVTEYIYLHVQGEPLLHPQFETIMDICDAHHMQVQLVTNGTYLNRYPSLIAHPSLRKVSFSIQSADFQTFSTLDEWMKPMIDFAYKASTLHQPYVEFRFWREATEPSPGYIYCMNYLRHQFSWKENKRRNNYTLLNHVYVNTAEAFDWPTLTNEREINYGTCHGGRHQIAILSDGTVVPCCLDNEGEIALGNIFETSLKEILSSSRYLSLIEGFKNGVIREPLCLHCTYRNRFKRP